MQDQLTRGPRRPAEVRVFPAAPRVLDRLWGPGWLAIGDAAASHDPLSGQGVTYAFETAFRAAEAVLAAAPFDAIAALYQEAITDRFARHLSARAGVYAEAAASFPTSPFWASGPP